MGSYFSSSSAPADLPLTAKVIDVDGSLREYSEAVRAAHVLGGSHPSCFLCDADSLLYGQFIQALGSNQLIDPGQLYFVLPVSKLGYRLTAADMAALAISASSAFAVAASVSRSGWRSVRRRKAVKVMPVIEPVDVDGCERFNESTVGSWKSGWFHNMTIEGRDIESSRPRLCVIEEIADQ